MVGGYFALRARIAYETMATYAFQFSLPVAVIDKQDSGVWLAARLCENSLNLALFLLGC